MRTILSTSKLIEATELGLSVAWPHKETLSPDLRAHAQGIAPEAVDLAWTVDALTPDGRAYLDLIK